MHKMLGTLLKDACCGCSACKYICPTEAIKIVKDSKGFDVPIVNHERCIQCNKCLNVCSFKKREKEICGVNSDVKIFALKKKHGRMQSQSGGAFAAMAQTAISDGYAVYGVKLEGQYAHYCRVTKLHELAELKGSKYVQASVGNIFLNVQHDLNTGKKVLFCGTPCHVDGLVGVLREKNVNIDNLIIVDLVCHGTPAPKVFADYYGYLKERFKLVKKFSFRFKEVGGWHAHLESFLQGNKRYFSSNYTNIFYSHLCLRESCYVCPYASTDRISDITIGDFWGIEKCRPDFDDGCGVSLVMINSAKGRKLFDSIKDITKYEEFNLEDCLQPNLKTPTSRPESTDNFWEAYFERGFLKTVKDFCGFKENDYSSCSMKYSRFGRFKYIVKRVLYKIFI